MTDTYQDFRDFADRFAGSHAPQAVDGAAYECPGVTVYHTHTQPLPNKGRLEVNATTPQAAGFDWSHEITLNDKVNGVFLHCIIRHNRTLEETYGKQVTPISPQRGAEILALLQEHQSG